jgi:hypothetical protein
MPAPCTDNCTRNTPATVTVPTTDTTAASLLVNVNAPSPLTTGATTVHDASSPNTWVRNVPNGDVNAGVARATVNASVAVPATQLAVSATDAVMTAEPPPATVMTPDAAPTLRTAASLDAHDTAPPEFADGATSAKDASP